ncbi:MAG: ATP-binding protein [Candidatus Geothermarchaeales archaeon]
MRIYGKDGSTFKIIAFPHERVYKGDYLLLEDKGNNVSILAQVVDVGYVETPGLLEELIREGLFNENNQDIDPYNVSDTTKFLRDTKQLLCVARGLINNGELSTRIYDLPSRAESTIRRVPTSRVIEMATPIRGRKIWLGTDRDKLRIMLNAEALDGSLTLITGMKGSGKSHLAKLFLLELLEEGAPLLVFDLNGEYVCLDTALDGKPTENRGKIEVYYPGGNLFFTLDYLGLESVSKVLTKVLGLPGVSAAVFNEIWPLAQNLGSVSPRLLLEVVNRSVTNMMVKDALTSRLMTLRSCEFITDDERKLVRVEDFIRPGGSASIIVLRDIPITSRKILVEMILSKLVSLLELNELPPLFLLAEEAHLYVRQTYWEDIVTRMRHFGLFVVFITNQPDALDHQVFRQLDNVFLFRFKNDHDLEMVSRISDIDAASVKSIVKETPPGVCLAIGRAVSSLPTLMDIRDLDVRAMGQTRTVFGSMRPAN